MITLESFWIHRYPIFDVNNLEFESEIFTGLSDEEWSKYIEYKLREQQ